jgi:hypothetical protein
LLEKDESFAERLIHAVAHAEKQLEDAMVNAMNREDDAANAALASSPHTLPSPVSAEPVSHVPKAKGLFKKSDKGTGKAIFEGGPVLSPVQVRIIERLNRIPNLQKQLAFIWPSQNSHATIIARDVKKFDFHRLGHGVIQHWADHFKL